MSILIATFLPAVATLWPAADSVFTQERQVSPATAQTGTRQWSFPRTADGQPDIQGMWIAADWGRPLETPAPGLLHVQLRPAAADRRTKRVGAMSR